MGLDTPLPKMIQSKTVMPTTPEQREQNRKRMADLRMRAVKRLGDKCAACGTTDLSVLQIDHKYSNGYAERTVRSLYMIHKYITLGRNLDQYLLLCANCHKRATRERGEKARRFATGKNCPLNIKLYGD